MKLFYLFLSFTLTGTLFVAARANQKAPAYLMPGAELRLDNLKSMNTGLQNLTKGKTAGETGQHKSVPTARISGTALDASDAVTKTVDTMLVTSYDRIYTNTNSEEPRDNLVTIEYDDHGYRTMMKESDRSVRYTYTTDGKGRWLSRKIESQENGRDGWRVNSIEERIIENDYVTGLTIYNTGSEEKPFKEISYEFEYRQGQTANTPSVDILGAAITREVRYDEEGNINNEARYTWIEPAKEYYATYFYNKGYSRMESEIGKDRLTARHYEINAENQTERLINESITFFGDKQGEYTKIYDENGNVDEERSMIHECYRDASGDSVEIEYNYKDDKFIPYQKIVYSPDMAEDNIDYTKDFNRTLTQYNYTDGNWTKVYELSVKNHVLDNGLCEITTNSYGHTLIEIVKAELIESDYGRSEWELYPAVINDDKSYYYVKEISQSVGPDYYLYEYYSATGELQKIIRQVTNELYDEYEFSIKGAGEDEWESLDEYTLNYEEDGAKFREVYKTGTNGKPESITEYITTSRFNNGKEFKISEKLFAYGDNDDFVLSTYEVLNPKDISKLYQSEKLEQKTLADGTIERTDWYYAENGSGKVDEANRTTVKNNVRTYYNYDNGTWIKTYANAIEESYVTEDGITVMITRSLSDDESYAINERKYESKETEDENGISFRMSADYRWDQENNCWIGENKTVISHYRYDFYTISAYSLNPISLYDDEYVVVLADEYYNFGGEIQGTNEIIHEWNAEKNDWEISRSDITKVEINGNQAKISRTEQEADRWSNETKQKTTVQTIERDNAYRITLDETIVKETTCRENEGPEVWNSHQKNVYTYNENNGMLEEHKTYTIYDDGTSDCLTDRYSYDSFRITTTGIENIVSDGDEAITIDGNTAKASGMSITVYNLGGIVVASGKDNVKLPENAGIYFIKAGKKTMKVAVK